MLKDGDDYYLTYSSFDAAPGLSLWHSRNLVDWRPIGHALPDPPAVVFASDLVKHGDTYYLYIPLIPAPWAPDFGDVPRIVVISAPAITGPWSEPVDLGVTGFIDPGHVVGEDGRRYLFLNGVSRVRLTVDGLSTDGPVEHVYDGWRYPDDWITEAYALEGPKLFRRGEFFYLVSAVGGTGGPPTGHMVIVARSRSVHGPWENDPANPVVRTWSADEAWWSRGHATAVEGPGGQWWLIYHGYENGYRTLGRQILLEPIRWTDDGWFVAEGLEATASSVAPHPEPVEGGASTSSASVSSRPASVQGRTPPVTPESWAFHRPGRGERDRLTIDGDTITLAGKGSDPSNSSPLCLVTGDHAYEVQVAIELPDEDATAGLLLFFNDRLFLGMGYDGTRMTTYAGGLPTHWREPVPAGRVIHLRIVNDRHIVTFFHSPDGATWTRHGVRSEASGYHANTAADLLSLRPALFAAGSGTVVFRGAEYRALP